MVDFFKKQSQESGFIQPSPQLMVCDRVTAKSYPLVGLIGIIDDRINEKCRIRVLMNFLKGGARIKIPYSFFEKQKEVKSIRTVLLSYLLRTKYSLRLLRTN